MRGALYAISEILVFLVIATLIGFLIGRWYAAWRSAAGDAEPVSAGPVAKPDDRVTAIERELAAARSQTEEIEKELSMARWQIGTLEDELAKRPDADGEA